MRKALMMTLAASGLAFAGAVPASAMPGAGVTATPLPLASAGEPEVTLVSGGCGPFRHRGFNGFCYPGGGYYGYGFYRPGFYRGYGYGYHGFHRGFFHRF